MPASSTPSPEAEQTGYFVTADGLRLYYQEWIPAAPPRSLILMVHGLGDHGGRYAHVVAHLVAQGHAVSIHDLRGHGRSEGRRAYVSAFDRYLDDFEVFFRTVRARRPDDLPIFLFGHSMGGAIALLYCLEREPGVNGLILSSPMLKVSGEIAPLLQKISQFLGRLLPYLPTVRLDLTALSRDPAVVARAQTDPLYYRGRLPARMGAELIRATRRIDTQMQDLRLPLLLLHGTADRLTEPNGSTSLYQRARSTDKTLALYPGFYHETFHEPDRVQVLHEIADWLDEHL